MANVTTTYYGPAGSDKDHPLKVGGKDYVRDAKTGTVEVTLPREAMDQLVGLGHVFEAAQKEGEIIVVPSAVVAQNPTADPDAPKGK